MSSINNSGFNTIPVLDLKPEVRHMRYELKQACHHVMEHARFVMGPEVEELEALVAGCMDVRHAVGVNSGTDALLISLRAAGIGEGDEVITTTFTSFATAEAIEMTGARPVFADISPKDCNIDPDAVEAAITPQTKAIVPVHLYGKSADMPRIMEIAEKHDLIVIEDCAQSFGAAWHDHGSKSGQQAGAHPERREAYRGRLTGTFGLAGAFSFFPSKNMGGFGDGGMIITNDDQVAAQAAMLRMHGARKKYHNEVPGYNSRLDTLQASMLQVKMKYFSAFNSRRRSVALRYIDELRDIGSIQLPELPDDGHVYHQFTLQLLEGDRDIFAEYLKCEGIQTAVCYPVPCHQLPLYKDEPWSLPVAERVKDRVISLPIGPFLSENDQDRVIAAVREYLLDVQKELC